MKKAILVCMLAIVAFIACKKGDAVGDNGCITRSAIVSTATLLSPADQAQVSRLFQQNNIPVNGLQFYQYTYNAAPGYVQPGPYEYVKANQNVNGLPVFFDGMIYNFRQGTLYYTGGNRYNAISLSTTPRLTLQQLRSVYLTAMAGYDKKYATLKDSCLTAQLGYYDLDAQSGRSPGRLIKAWKVNIGNSSYPVAYLRDDNDESIYIDNGIRTEYDK